MMRSASARRSSTDIPAPVLVGSDVDSRTGAGLAACPASAIYTGMVRHRRHLPRAHAFDYRLFLMYLDLAEVDTVFARRWLWSVGTANLASFRRSDYLGDPALPLDQCVRDCVEQRTGRRPGGPIRLLAHLRYFGHCFNPVSFYYCFAADGSTLETVVAEVTNTPWQERHQYVLPVADAQHGGAMLAWSFDKAMHVSPFMGMDHLYAWQLDKPGQRLRVHMDVLDPHATAQPGRESVRRFDATLSLHKVEISGASLAGVLVRYPFMTLRVVVAIHWQALRLWLRGVPVHDHPVPARPTT